MAKPSTKQGLIDYALRKLGAPVLEINIDDDQIDDLVDDALQLFNERCFDGVERMYLKYRFTQNDIDRGKAHNQDGSDNTVGLTTTTGTFNTSADLILNGTGTGKTPSAVSTTYTSKPMWTTTIDGGTF